MRKLGNYAGVGAKRMSCNFLMFLQTVQKIYSNSVMDRRAKISVCSSDLKSLVAEDPLLQQSLELRELKGGRSQKISVGSLSTDITDAFSECDISICSGEREREAGPPVRRQRSVHTLKPLTSWLICSLNQHF